MDWRRFFVYLLSVFLGGSFVLFSALALLDPWGALPFHTPLPRLPADHSQRWAYPEIARDQRFDAAIIGDSGSRLLDPAALDPAVGARFANLAMVKGFAFEQMRLLDVFLAAHPEPRAVLIGLDRQWCERGDEPAHFGYDPIPEFLYDGGVLGTLANLFNMHAIETAWRSASALFGVSPRPYGSNGYALIDVDRHPYDPALARRLIDADLAQPWPPPPGPDPRSWRYPALAWLAQRLDRLPASTRKLLVFVPRFHLYPPPGGDGAAMMDECKRRVVALVRGQPNAEVYDMSIPSPVTMQSDRWWDTVHARPETMAEVSRDLAQAIGNQPNPNVKVLAPGDAASALAR